MQGDRQAKVRELLALVGLNPEHGNATRTSSPAVSGSAIGIARAIALEPRAVGARRAGVGARRVDPGRRREPARGSAGRLGSRTCSSRTTSRWCVTSPTKSRSCTSARSSSTGRPTTCTSTRSIRTRRRCCRRCRCPSRASSVSQPDHRCKATFPARRSAFRLPLPYAVLAGAGHLRRGGAGPHRSGRRPSGRVSLRRGCAGGVDSDAHRNLTRICTCAARRVRPECACLLLADRARGAPIERRAVLDFDGAEPELASTVPSTP